jgi:protein-L-isoaspartate(D-aspartate) O-methyltransferase
MQPFSGRLWMVGLFVLLSGTACRAQEREGIDFQERRERMVREQIEGRGIKDSRVLDAMGKVERHRFVPDRWRHQAYADAPLPIGEGQTISQPYVVAVMTDALELEGEERILEVGTGSGYQAAVLGEICRKVYTIEINETLGKRAKDLLLALGYDNVQVKVGDGYQGWKAFSPFDGIIVTCAPTGIPGPLKDQLAEGGKMVIPVGSGSFQELVVLTKREGILEKQIIAPVRFVPMLKRDGTGY